MAFVALTSGQCDADSSLDEVLMQLIRTNLDDLDAARVTNGDSHDHSGGDGAAIAEGALASSAVTQGKLKTSTVTSLAGGLTGSGADITLNAYAFFPMIHVNKDGGSGGNLTGHSTDGVSPDAPRFRIDGVTNGGSGENYDVEFRYIQA